MIYLVTNQKELFECFEYKTISVEESLTMLNSVEVLQYDSETTGLDPHLCTILCAQFGNDSKDFQIVVDCTTVDILLYKDVLDFKELVAYIK